MTAPADLSAWRARDAALVLVVGLVASALAYAAVAPDLTTFESFAFVFPAQWVGTVGALAWLAGRRRDWRRELRVSMVRRDLWGLPQGAFVQIVLSVLAYLVVVELFDGTAPTQEVVDTAASAIGGVETLLVVLGLGVIGPATEELVFRGVLLRALEPRGHRRAIVISSAVFAGLHMLDPGAIIAVPFLFVLGVLLAHRTLRTGRLGAAFALHSGFNLITVAALLGT